MQRCSEEWKLAEHVKGCALSKNTKYPKGRSCRRQKCQESRCDGQTNRFPFSENPLRRTGVKASGFDSICIPVYQVLIELDVQGSAADFLYPFAYVACGRLQTGLQGM
jgi:hypothetical protein